jgi:hypothetical protein
MQSFSPSPKDPIWLITALSIVWLLCNRRFSFWWGARSPRLLLHDLTNSGLIIVEGSNQGVFASFPGIAMAMAMEAHGTYLVSAHKAAFGLLGTCLLARCTFNLKPL